MNESKRCISLCTIAPVISKVIPWKDAIFAKKSLSNTMNIFSATLPHWNSKHSECQDSCLITPPKLWACYCLCWVGGKWLVSSLESCVTSSSQKSSMEHTLASSISLFLSGLTQRLIKHHLHRLQQWSDKKSSPLLGAYIFIYIYLITQWFPSVDNNVHELLHPDNGFPLLSSPVTLYGRQQGILFSQPQTSSSHSSFLNHHELTAKCSFPNYICLFSWEHILHTWNVTQKHIATSIFRQADCSFGFHSSAYLCFS